MAACQRIRARLRQKNGDAAVDLIMTVAMLILIFAVLVTALIYITEFYTASYICRRVVRTIEISGEYNERTVYDLANSLGGNNLENMTITVTAPYMRWWNRKIQLRDEFTVRLSANYPIQIMMLGSRPIRVNLPIQLKLSGRSEVFWK